MAEMDPFEVLRQNNPVDPGEIDAYSPAASRTLDMVAQRPSPRTRRLVLIAVALLAVIVAAAMAWVLATRDVEALLLTCYEETSLTSNRVAVASEAFPSASDCEQPWEEGILRLPGIAPGTVPDLTACVSDDGGLAVFPSAELETCSRLGLATPTPDQPGTPLANLATAQAEIRDYLFSSSCRLLDDAEQEIRRILDENGLTDWTINRQPDQPGRPCASIDYDADATVVIIVPNTST